MSVARRLLILQLVVLALVAVAISVLAILDERRDSDAATRREVTSVAETLALSDATAAALCKDNNMDIVVFDVTRPGNITRAVLGEAIGTLVGSRR